MKRLLLLFLFLPLLAPAQVIVTVAGTGTPGYNGDGLTATATELNAPYGVALDGDGNLYICDAFNYRIRKMSPTGIMTTIAGNGTDGFSGDGGSASWAMISSCNYLAVDRKSNVYITDEHRIRKITPTGVITTIAGTGTAGYNGDGIPATTAMLNLPQGVAADSIGNIYIMDHHNFRIRRVDTFGMISTIVGTGIQGFSADGSYGDTSKLDSLGSITIDKGGNLFFSDNIRIRKINSLGIISTVAGNGIIGYSGDSGPATSAMIRAGAIALDTLGNLFLAEGTSCSVRKVTTDGIIRTIAGDGLGGYSGDGGNPMLAKLRSPQGVTVSKSGEIYIGDVGNHRVRMVTTGIIDEVDGVKMPAGSVEVYPNPCHKQCTIVLKNAVTEKAEIVISNLAGEEIYWYITVTNSPVTLQTTWPPGAYIISATVGQQHFTGKLFIE
jgi:hypothetical protein